MWGDHRRGGCCNPSPSPRPAARVAGGGDIDGFAQEAGLKLKPIDKAAGIWEVRTLEDYHKTPPRLVTTRRLATPATIDRTDALARLGALPFQPGTLDPSDVEAELNRLGATHPGDLGPLEAWASLATTACPTERLEASVRAVYGTIKHVRGLLRSGRQYWWPAAG